MAFTESFETINGCKTRLMRGGKGAPLLFLHGARGAGAWLPFMEKLSERFEMIVPEHPGFGGTDSPDWLDNIGDVAFFYLDMIEKFGLQGINLVGTSLGGWISCEIAVRDDAALNRLVLVAPAGIHVKGLSKGDSFMWSPEQTVRNLFHDQKIAEAALARPMSDAEQLAEMKNKLTFARLAWQPRLYNPHLYKWLHRIATPTLIIWGDDDKLLPASYGPEFQKLIPKSRLEIIKDCGHVPQIEKADEFVAKIVAFVGETGR